MRLLMIYGLDQALIIISRVPEGRLLCAHAMVLFFLLLKFHGSLSKTLNFRVFPYNLGQIEDKLLALLLLFLFLHAFRFQ